MKFAVSKPGTTVAIKTGEWRSQKPVVDMTKCIKCATCQNYCPEGCMGVPGQCPQVDYDYCKGCGLCANECPVKCIKMEQEIKSVGKNKQ
ncbi:MAG: 4Fe-4S binding protein [Candidatus Micrarchaeia archaeon]|jgi:2-oxoacid:acceptor oxidoreductase delta subunit (pyruvate/2-ketoisovalerate family)